MCAFTQPSLVASASVQAGSLLIDVRVEDDWGGMCFGGWQGAPNVAVAPAVGTLTSVTLSEYDRVVTIEIELAAAPSDGTVELSGLATANEGVYGGPGGCSGIAHDCSLLEQLSVTFGDGGEVTVRLAAWLRRPWSKPAAPKRSRLDRSARAPSSVRSGLALAPLLPTAPVVRGQFPSSLRSSSGGLSSRTVPSGTQPSREPERT